MNQTCYIVLGAILAILGGFIQSLYQEWKDRKKHDKLLLLNAHSLIQDLEHIRNFADSNGSIGTIADRIYQIGFEIQGNKFKELRLKLKKFGKKHKESNNFDQLDSEELKSIENELIKEIGLDLEEVNNGKTKERKKSQAD